MFFTGYMSFLLKGEMYQSEYPSAQLLGQNPEWGEW